MTNPEKNINIKQFPRKILPMGSMTYNERIKIDMPLPKIIMCPYIFEAAQILIYAVTGAGKSMIATTIGLGIAGCKSIFGGKWTVPNGSRKVIYFDGEMLPSVYRDRETQLLKGHKFEIFDDENWKVYHAINSERFNLFHIEGQNIFWEQIDINSPEVIILDNLNVLYRPKISGNLRESWDPMQKILFQLKRENIAVIIISHAGKSGSELGSSGHTMDMDVVLKLYPTINENNKYEMTVKMACEKGRMFGNENKKPFTLNLEKIHFEGEEKSDYGLIWRPDEKENLKSRREIAEELLRDREMTYGNIQKETGYSLGQISKINKALGLQANRKPGPRPEKETIGVK